MSGAFFEQADAHDRARTQVPLPANGKTPYAGDLPSLDGPTVRRRLQAVATILQSLSTEAPPALALKLRQLAGAAVQPLPPPIPAGCAVAGCDEPVPSPGPQGGRRRRYCLAHRASRAKRAPNVGSAAA